MKHLFSTLFITMFFMLSGQEKSSEDIPRDIIECFPEMGKDIVSTLNVCESKCLNLCFQKNRDIFDFSGKKVAFFKGNAGTIKSTKKEYFDRIKQFTHPKGFLPSSSEQLIIFSDDEIKKTGYDAVIISQSKKYITNREIIKRLKNNK